MVDNGKTQAGAMDAHLPGAGKRVSILGLPLSFGQGLAGVDLGPSAMRVAGIADRIAELGYEVRDLDDLEFARPRKRPAPAEKLKYLVEIQAACERIAIELEKIVEAAEMPITIGGDHSIAIRSLACVAKAFRKRDETLAVCSFDSHVPITPLKP